MSLPVLHNYKYENLHRELNNDQDRDNHLYAKIYDYVEEFLIHQGIYSIAQIDEAVKEVFWIQVNNDESFNERQKKSYRNVLERIQLSFYRNVNKSFLSRMENLGEAVYTRNKVYVFLMENQIESAEDITIVLREQFQNYLERSGIRNVNEYVRAFDRLKLSYIKERENWGMSAPKYKNEKFFLLYYPVYKIAETFYYLQDMNDAIFDFSLAGSGMFKRQIYKMLIHSLELPMERKERREKYLVPLKKLYLFGLENDIEDVEQLTGKHIDSFYEYIKPTSGKKAKVHMQVIDYIRRYLFVSAKTINWDANVWYFERIHLADGRMNESRLVDKLSFDDIENEDNRNLVKTYMKYLIGYSQDKAILTIRRLFYSIKDFVKYCDEKEISIARLSEDQVEQYVDYLQQKEIGESYFNLHLLTLSRFMRYMELKQLAPMLHFRYEYYLKKDNYVHINRSVPKDEQELILSNLHLFPETLRIMYLVLWGTGIRVNELCQLKGNALTHDGIDGWIVVYQNKMKTEKMIPTPDEVFILLDAYIKKYQIASEDYIFQAKKGKGRAYDAATFSKQMKDMLLKIGLSDIKFKAHDYRHTQGTEMHQEGVSIQTIRDYLGHKTEEMTKQYIDYVEEQIEILSEEYFSSQNK